MWFKEYETLHEKYRPRRPEYWSSKNEPQCSTIGVTAGCKIPQWRDFRPALTKRAVQRIVHLEETELMKTLLKNAVFALSLLLGEVLGDPPLALVLLFHSVDTSRSPVSVSPDVLRYIIDWFVALGADFVPIERLDSADFSTSQLKVAVTFDDAYESVLTHAAPILAEKGIPATVFVPTGYIGGLNSWDVGCSGIPELRVCNKSQLKELVSMGFMLGSHGVTHRPVTSWKRGDWKYELIASRECLEELVGKPVRSFSYPYNAWTAESIEHIKSARYEYACVGFGGVWSRNFDRLMIPRVTILDTENMTSLRCYTSPGFRIYCAFQRTWTLLKSGGKRI